MMRSSAIYLFLAMLAPAVVGTAAQKGASNDGKKLIQSCDAHKFETVVDVVVGGQRHQSKVKLCGVEGQSDAEWLDTLRDAIKKLEGNKEMPASQREQIVTAIRAEIARLSIASAGPALPRPSRQVAAGGERPLARDYATLPPLPLPTETQPSLRDERAAGREPSPGTPESPLSIVKPAPSPVRNERAYAAPVATKPLPTAAPRLRFGCDTPGDLSSDAPCSNFEGDTMITVHAGDDVPAGTLLQFVRNNDPRAEITLGGLRRGGTLRMPLPAKVCAGFTSGKLELRIVNADVDGAMQPLGSDGPFTLRC